MVEANPVVAAQVERSATVADALRQRLGERIVGAHDVIEQVLTGLLAGGRGLLEGVPGLG